MHIDQHRCWNVSPIKIKNTFNNIGMPSTLRPMFYINEPAIFFNNCIIVYFEMFFFSVACVVVQIISPVG